MKCPLRAAVLMFLLKNSSNSGAAKQIFIFSLILGFRWVRDVRQLVQVVPNLVQSHLNRKSLHFLCSIHGHFHYFIFVALEARILQWPKLIRATGLTASRFVSSFLRQKKLKFLNFRVIKKKL